MTQRDAFNGIKDVREQYLAAAFSVRRAVERAALDPNPLRATGEALTPRHLTRCLANLEAVYALRLFVTFEGIVRDFWASVRPRPTPRRTRMEVLMNRVVIECQIPIDVADRAHEVRIFRNAIAHPQPHNPLTFDECKSRLAYFVSYLPARW